MLRKVLFSKEGQLKNLTSPYQVSRNVLQYDQLHKKEMAPFSGRLGGKDSVCRTEEDK